MRGFKSAKVTNRYNSAPIWKRFLAYLIDLIIVDLVVTLPFRSYLDKFSSNFDFLFMPMENKLYFISLFVVFALVLYFSILEFKTGQTLGKMIFNIYTVSLLKKPMTFSQALLRNITKSFPIVLLVDVAYMFFKRGNQRLFEVFSGTMVVEKELVFR